MEKSITGDFALVKAWKADKAGNVIFRYKCIYIYFFFFRLLRPTLDRLGQFSLTVQCHMFTGVVGVLPKLKMAIISHLFVFI